MKGKLASPEKQSLLALKSLVDARLALAANEDAVMQNAETSLTPQLTPRGENQPDLDVEVETVATENSASASHRFQDEDVEMLA